MSKRAERFQQAIVLLLVLGVGILLGAQLHKPPTPSNECAECVCPSEPPEVEVSMLSAPATPRKKGQKLPIAPEPTQDAKRGALLRWVRLQAPALETCRGGSSSGYRVSVSLDLAEDGTVNRASVGHANGEVPRKVVACLEKQLETWSIPEPLKPGGPSVLFGLRL